MTPKAFELRVDPIQCDAHGLCAAHVPELIELDEWGYPIIARGPIDGRTLAHARRAVDMCPALALRLEAHSGAPQMRRPTARSTSAGTQDDGRHAGSASSSS